MALSVASMKLPSPFLSFLSPREAEERRK
jgi:hypothetical protein